MGPTAMHRPGKPTVGASLVRRIHHGPTLDDRSPASTLPPQAGGRPHGPLQRGSAVAICLAIGLGGCAIPPRPQSHTDRATLAACRDYASQVYDRQNRGTIYSINQSGLPYSGSYQVDYQTNQLAARYHNDEVVDDCVRNTGTETSRVGPAEPETPKP